MYVYEIGKNTLLTPYIGTLIAFISPTGVIFIELAGGFKYHGEVATDGSRRNENTYIC
jgi:hypothetical protein